MLEGVSKFAETERGSNGEEIPPELTETYPHRFYVAHSACPHGNPRETVQLPLPHTPQVPNFPDSLERKSLQYMEQIDVNSIYRDRSRKDTYLTK